MFHPSYIEFRDQALAYQPKIYTKKEDSIQLCLVDWHKESGIVSLVAVDDGSVSLHLSNGTSFLGCGKYRNVRQGGLELLLLAQHYIHSAQRADKMSLPNPGEIQFYFKRNAELFLLSGGDNPSNAPEAVIHLFKVMQSVISDIRELQESKHGK